MKLIALTGIAGHEKVQHALHLAVALQGIGYQVGMVDNSDHAPIPATDGIVIHRLTKGSAEHLYNVVQRITWDMALLVVAESVNPEGLLVMLGDWRNLKPDLEILLVALVDDRTCGCFPQLQEMLEACADITLRAPFDVQEVLKVL